MKAWHIDKAVDETWLATPQELQSFVMSAEGCARRSVDGYTKEARVGASAFVVALLLALCGWPTS